MQIAELTEELLLIVPIVIFIEGLVAVVAWFAYGSKGGRGARIAAWLGLVTLTLWVGSAIAFPVLYLLLFNFGNAAVIAGAIVITLFMLLMPFGWAAVVRHHGSTDSGNEPGSQPH
jgi:hypothetical protein